MRVYSEDFKKYRIKVIKVKGYKQDQLQLLFTVGEGVRVYKRYLDELGSEHYSMNYNGNFIVMYIKL